MRSARTLVVPALLGTFLCVSAAGVARAEPGERPAFPIRHGLETGLFVGGYFINEAHEYFQHPDIPQKPLAAAALDFGVRAAWWFTDFVAVEGEAAFMPTSVDGGGGSVWLNGFRGHVVLQYPELVSFAGIVPFLVGGLGSTGVWSDETALGNDQDFAGHWGVGLRWYPLDWLGVRIDGRHVIAPEVDTKSVTSHFEVLAGVSMLFGEPAVPPDGDGDGVPDSSDDCPTVAGEKPRGCPPADSDGDGVIDREDACPDEAGEPTDGCPIRDTDSDGLFDNVDECIDEPEDRDEFEDGDGCPDPDNDGDGILDADDKCPQEAGVAAAAGCADPDRDADTVPDRIDNCPDEAGTPENQGCASKQLAKIEGDKIIIEGVVHFETGQAKIAEKSFPLLDNVAAVLVAHPELGKVRIEGHTDNQGDADFNRRLSQRRANAVMRYLVKKGVPEERVTATGYGPDRPIADNKTLEGRQKNRRVEFILEKGEGREGGEH